MGQPLSSQLDLYNLFIATVQNKVPGLTDTNDGSILDGLAGVYSIAGMELQRQTVTQFNKTFIDLANGPEITGNTDDLQTLAVDHYGSLFERPGAVEAVDTVTFRSLNTTTGTVTILAGTVVQTQPDANGNVQQYGTNSTVTLTKTGSGTPVTVSVGVTALVAGAAGSASAGTITSISTPLTDNAITVTNAGNSTGVDAQDDAEYRETIRNLIVSLRAATKAAIQAVALTVPGITVATAVETELPVIQYNIGTGAIQAGASYFYIPFVTLYVFSAAGAPNSTLLAEVQTAINQIRAFGVFINVVAANPVTINWTAHLTLNSGGPNFTLFSGNPAQIIAAMTNYIATLPSGTNFTVATANAAILAIYGPSGTNDLTAFATTVPAGDVTIASGYNAIPGTVGLV